MSILNKHTVTWGLNLHNPDEKNSFLLNHFGQNKETVDTQIPFGLSSATTKGKNLIKSDWAFQKSILD